MKKVVLLFVIFLSVYTINAQSNYIILNGGATKPRGEFANNDFFNPESGFATGGYNFGFEVGYFFNPWVGIGGSFKFNNSSFDNGVINNHLQTQYENIFDTIYLASDKYSLQNFLVGPYGKLDVTNHISLFGKFFIGVMSAFRPEQTLNWTEPGQDPNLLYVESKLASAFSWDLGGGILFKLNDQIGIIFMADYISANPKLEEFNYNDLAIETNKQEIRYFNLNVGLALSL